MAYHLSAGCLQGAVECRRQPVVVECRRQPAVECRWQQGSVGCPEAGEMPPELAGFPGAGEMPPELVHHHYMTGHTNMFMLCDDEWITPIKYEIVQKRRL